MKKILLVKGGRFAHPPAQEWSQNYVERIRRWTPIETEVLKEDQIEKRLSQLREAGKRIVLLDGRGKAHSTETLSELISKWRDLADFKETVFIIGSSYGFDDGQRKLAHHLWSLSPLTLAGDVAWVVMVEQLYRALSILEKSPYHHS